ncbi:MAG: dipeptidase [Gemmatimonadota bacterium]
MKRKTKNVVWVILGLLLLGALLGFAVAPGMLGRSMNGLTGEDLVKPSPAARALHDSLRVVDLHSDALLWNRNLLRRGSWGHVDVPRLVEGHVAVQSFTTVTKVPQGINIEANSAESDLITLIAVLERWPMRTWGSLAERALYQASKLRAFADNSGGRLTVLRTRDDLSDYLRRRISEPDITAGFLGIEGAHALEGDPTNVERLYEAGFRMFGLTHFFDNEVGGSAHGLEKGGLTPFGAQVVDRAQELGILIDLAHASPALMDDVLDRVHVPVVVSHGGVKGTCDNRRNIDDGRLARIAAGGGVVGIGLWKTAICGRSPASWARAVHHAVDIMGVEHVSLGSDWDGAVSNVVDAAGTVYLTQALMDEGFTSDEIRKIMGENALRVLAEVLPAP